jgi:hypothetical protein
VLRYSQHRAYDCDVLNAHIKEQRMDPKQTLLDIARTLDADEAFERLAEYFEWRRAGGFEPIMDDGTRGDIYANELRDEWRRRSA